MNQEPLLIKRYQNRKMYDTEKSCYVDIPDINQVVKGGRSIEVIDNKNRTNITNITLMSVIHQNEIAAKSKPFDMAFMGRVLEAGGLTAYATQLEGRLS